MKYERWKSCVSSFLLTLDTFDLWHVQNTMLWNIPLLLLYPSEELEFTANSPGAHIEAHIETHGRLILGTLSYLTSVISQ